MTTEQASELQDTLEKMMSCISAGDDIAEQLLRIQQLSEDIEATAPKMLMHYLERRSYAKALDFLNELKYQ